MYAVPVANPRQQQLLNPQEEEMLLSASVAAPSQLALGVTIASSVRRPRVRPSHTAPIDSNDDPRPFVRALAIVDPELAANLVSHLEYQQQQAVKSSTTGVELDCNPFVVNSHVYVGEKAELCVAGADIHLAGWMPVHIDQVMLRIGTAGRRGGPQVYRSIPSNSTIVS